MSFGAFLALAFGVNLALNTVLWSVSLVRRNVTVIDPFWGLGFLVMVAALLPVSAGNPGRIALVALLTCAWGWRFGLHLYWRSWGHTEETTFYPYRAWREAAGRSFWWVSYLRAFLPQTLGTTLIGLPILAGLHLGGGVGPGLLDLLGAGLWLVGFVVEATADHQLGRFKRDPDNRGRILDRGLWAYSRHPNYFGDALVWWGLFLVAASTGAWWTVVSPILMTYLLTRVSGVPMVERRSRSAGSPEYAAYARTTNAFLPGRRRTDPRV